MSRRLALVACALPLLVAAWVRVDGLGAASLWQDEALCVINARLLPAELFEVLARQNQPPGFHLLLGGWIGVFGDGAFAARAFAAVCGFAAVVLFGALAAQWYGPAARVPALWIAATSSFWVVWSRDACMYALVLLLGLLVVYVLLQALLVDESPPPTLWLLLGVLRAALLYVHYFAAFLAVGEAALVAYLAWWRRRPARASGWLLSGVVTLLLFVPWLPVFLEQHARVAESWWSQPLTLGRFVNVPRQWLLWIPEVDHAGWNLLIAVPLLVGAGWTAWTLWAAWTARHELRRGAAEAEAGARRPRGSGWWRRRIAPAPPPHAVGIVAALLLCGGQVAAAAAVSLRNSLFETKYLIIASAPFYLVLLGALLPAARAPRLLRHGTLALFVAAQFVAFGLLRWHPGYRHPDLRGAADHIRANFRGGDIVVATETSSFTVLYHELNTRNPRRPVFMFLVTGERPPFWQGLEALPKSAFVDDPDLLGAGQKRIWLPLPRFDERPWEDSAAVRDGLAASAAHLHQQLGGGAPTEPAATFARVTLYCIPVEKEFDYAEMWRRWQRWMGNWQRDNRASWLGRFLAPPNAPPPTPAQASSSP